MKRHEQRTADLEREIEEELRFHIAMRVQENLRAGLSPETAQADALARFGDYQQVKADCVALTQEKRASAPGRKILQGIIWAMLGCGLTLRSTGQMEQVQQCGNILIAIAGLWRLLLWLRLSVWASRSVALSSAPLLISEPLPSKEYFSLPTPAYDDQGRTPVERLLRERE